MDVAATAQQKQNALLAMSAPLLDVGVPCDGLPAVTVDSAQVVASVLVPAISATVNGIATELAPAFCKVSAVATPVSGSLISIELWMPVAGNWNGRFVGMGAGGYAGAGTNEGNLTGAGMIALKQGFAVGSTDMGTTPATTLNGDALIGQPQKWVDWGARATHLMTTISKSLIAAYYGRAPQWSYFNGCSTGGQQGMMEAQRYPQDYDGILAGSPANNRTHVHTQFVWNYNALNATANSRFTPVSGNLLRDAMVKACAVKTGGVDGDAFITDPRGCDFDPGVLQCAAGSAGTDCLTADQVDAARKIYSGTRTASGVLIYPGMPKGTEDSFLGMGDLPEPFLASIFKWVFGPTWTASGYDFDTGTDIVDSLLAKILNANNPSLDAFNSRGGKLISFHGWYDGAIPPQDSINAYKATVAYEATKGPGNALQRTQNYYRLYMVPGLGHCDGGPGPSSFGQRDLGTAQPFSADASGDMMIALQQWVEGGIVPKQLIGTNTSTGMTRPICPYPQVAVYSGTGPTNVASSFTCRASPYDAPKYNPTPDPKYVN